MWCCMGSIDREIVYGTLTNTFIWSNPANTHKHCQTHIDTSKQTLSNIHTQTNKHSQTHTCKQTVKHSRKQTNTVKHTHAKKHCQTQTGKQTQSHTYTRTQNPRFKHTKTKQTNSNAGQRPLHFGGRAVAVMHKLKYYWSTVCHIARIIYYSLSLHLTLGCCGAL